MDGLYFEFSHTITVPCLDEDPSHCLANAWNLGACGEDWRWRWVDSDHVRISFKREADSIAFLSRAPVALPSNQGVAPEAGAFA